MFDKELRINSYRFPHMAALAKDSLWFPNAVSAADHTATAVPAILSGELPEKITAPTLEKYPRNLFTLLGDTLRMVAFEGPLHLCPPELNDLDFTQAGAIRPDLLGRRAKATTSSLAAGFTARLDEPRRPVYDPESDSAPSLIRGGLFGGAELPLDRPPVVAIALNGVVQGVTRAWHDRHPGWRRFHVTIPTSKFVPGENQLQVWLVDPDRPEKLLGPL